ncbi:MAG: hypothetical protein JWN94_175 [Betaproteobacteria bacterium]|nr:hypothetical protein [Betaproteobacteria bacterium]
MKSTLATLTALLALTFTIPAQATDEISGANSVAGMLQRKHDSELRSNLVAENRWQEIRQLDAATNQTVHAQTAGVLERFNKQLARDTGVAGAPIDARALECEADVTHVR